MNLRLTFAADSPWSDEIMLADIGGAATKRPRSKKSPGPSARPRDRDGSVVALRTRNSP